MNATKQQNEKGQLVCTGCDGEGIVEVQLAARSSTQISPEYAVERCPDCDGGRVRICANCTEPATVVGENGHQAYCDVGHAWADGNWPECFHSDGKPQDPACAPFCSTSCVERFERRVAEVRP